MPRGARGPVQDRIPFSWLCPLSQSLQSLVWDKLLSLVAQPTQYTQGYKWRCSGMFPQRRLTATARVRYPCPRLRPDLLAREAPAKAFFSFYRVTVGRNYLPMISCCNGVSRSVFVKWFVVVFCRVWSDLLKCFVDVTLKSGMKKGSEVLWCHCEQKCEQVASKIWAICHSADEKIAEQIAVLLMRKLRANGQQIVLLLTRKLT